MTAVPAPKLVSTGQFAIYETPTGGVHVTMQIAGESEPRHFDVPPMMVKMLKAKGGGLFDGKADGNGMD